MKYSFPALRLAALALMATAIALNATASYVITSDTATEFSGTFSESGSSGDDLTPSNYGSFPGSSSPLSIYRQFVGSQSILYIATPQIGTPDSPTYNEVVGAGSLPSKSGTYTDGGVDGNQTVNWSYALLQNSGGAGGTFSGSFSFINVTPVPEPAETAAAIGLALGAFALVRRSRQA